MKLLPVLRAIHQGCEIKCRDLNKGAFLTKKDLFSTIQVSDDTSLHPEIVELRQQVKDYGAPDIPLIFVERFCTGTIAEVLINHYPINLAEAFVLGLVTLGINKLNDVNFKLGISGVISRGTLIKGERVDSVEEIANFIFDSLEEAKLIYISADNHVYPGTALKLAEIFS